MMLKGGIWLIRVCYSWLVGLILLPNGAQWMITEVTDGEYPLVDYPDKLETTSDLGVMSTSD